MLEQRNDAPGRLLWESLRTPEPPDLCQERRPGTLGVGEVRERVARLAPRDGDTRDRLMAASLLYHDHYNEAHDLVQDMTDADGSLVHALLHRREPDYWNANYWYRRAGDHELYGLLARRVGMHRPSGSAGAIADRLVMSGTFDPMAMVAACEEAGRPGGSVQVRGFLRTVQEWEFELLIGLLAGRG